MNLAQKLKDAKEKLNGVTTRTTLETGDVVIERRAEDGQFSVVAESSEQTDNCEAEDSNKPVSNRRRKLVERVQRFGYVIDLEPDLEVAHVCEGLYLSAQDVAHDIDLLRKHEITHILNLATGVRNAFPEHFTYLALNVLDYPTYDLKQHFAEALQFMKGAIDGGGRVLVHCNAGISRSSTLAIAYVMQHGNKSMEQAYEHVRSVRKVARPNVGFRWQLEQFEAELKELKEMGEELKETNETAEESSKI